jgi:transcriptional regulator with XRE-family HTH domain
VLADSERSNCDTSKMLRAELGAWLKDLRLDKGLSQRDLAAKLDLEYYTFISQLENGRGRIPPSRYLDWACALGQDPKNFVVRLLSCYDPVTYDVLYGNQAEVSAR